MLYTYVLLRDAYVECHRKGIFGNGWYSVEFWIALNYFLQRQEKCHSFYNR